MSTRSLAQRIKDALHEQQQVISRLQSENAKLRKVVEYHAMMGSLLARGVLEEVEKND